MPRSSRRSNDPQVDPPQPTPDSPSITRRTLISAAAGAVGATVVRGGGDVIAQAPAAPVVPEDPTKVLGPPPTELGQRSPFERPKRRVNRTLPSGSSLTPLQDLRGIITPSDLHFERHHGGVPAIDPATYRLIVHGLVDRPMVFTLAELERFPATTRICFVECAGNGRRGYVNINRESTAQEIDGLTSNSEWVGVPLKTILREVGAKSSATWFLAEGFDAAKMTRSIPIEKAMDDALVVYAQNGESLRPEQGYPVRLLLPGWEGNASVKWLRRIELADRPFMTREETSKYTDVLPEGKVRQFSFEMDAKSIITFPSFPTTLTPGWWEISGLAWSGRGKVTRVDISSDGGSTWTAATLHDPVLSKCHTRFTHLWKWTGGESMLMSRAVDETGYVQPTLAELRKVRSVGSHYHLNNIRAWKVEKDGRVFFGLEG
jgi:sulfane dehydrogenase subunit SoxC